MDGKLHIGLDIGAVSLNTVVVDEKRNILEERYTRIKGQPLQTVEKVLGEILSRISADQITGLAVTGIGGKLVAELLGGSFVNEVIAQSKAIEHLHPTVRTIIEMGGEDSKLILLQSEEDGRLQIEDFAMNTLCAAGTGSFLDQQASRLGLTIEEFGELALKSKVPPRIAGRCSVFAKSDMIHLQQGATPDYDIVAGLCFAMARNFKSNIAKGKKIDPPVSFQGGVAANPGVRRAFVEVLELKKEAFIIPTHFASTGAIGAVFIIQEEPDLRKSFLGMDALSSYIGMEKTNEDGLEPLKLRPEALPDERDTVLTNLPKEGKVKAYLGVDVGSISTNVVVINEQMKVLSKRYLMTAGRPLEAIKQGLLEVGEEIGDRVEIAGAATTGSGRYLTGDFIGADVIRNEITAQATAAAAIDPKVDTIFEIGGQDSKYISLSNGAIVDFAMNKVCAAGTGSFLEEQAEKLGISIKEEFADLALSSKSPVRLGERCTVFMESDLVHHQQQGAGKDNLVAGLAYSIVENYLNKVVEDRKVGNNIFFQGGTAFNKAVVAAFEKVCANKITVPAHHEVTGAIGAAILALRENTKAYSNFKGFDLAHRHYEIDPFECNGCPNRCEIKKVTVENERPLFYGGRCERYEIDRQKVDREVIRDLFGEREELLLNIYSDEGKLPENAPEIGIPRILHFHELYPYWKAFLTELGYRVVLSDATHKGIIHKGVEHVVAETCFPIKVSNGHVLDLIEKGIKRIFLPSVIDMKQKRAELGQGYNCPYVQTFPYTAEATFPFESLGVEILKPVFHLSDSPEKLKNELIRFGRMLGRGPYKVKRAMAVAERAQEAFYQEVQEMGREVLDALGPQQRAMVIISRAYNGCDSGVNLNLPKKLRDLGVLAIPIDCLPIDDIELDKEITAHYWKYGQRFMSAAKIIGKDPRLNAIYITNFGCGPDSFIQHFFKDGLRGSPHLQIEIDEHSADVGAITRLEAFLDSLKNAREQGMDFTSRPRINAMGNFDIKRKVYIANMTDHAYAMEATFHACGIPAEVLPESNEETLTVGRKLTSGKECYPCILTTGDIAYKVQEPDFERERSAFFMPGGNGPCRFGQYNRFHRLVLDDMGYSDVPIYSFAQDQTMYQEIGIIGKVFSKLAWRGIAAIDFLEKAQRETRPYEREKGKSDRVYSEYLKKVCDAIRDSGDVFSVLEGAKKDFESIDTNGRNGKPVAGIVGEIYLRSNRFANENIIRLIEELGGEVWMPPISEWLLYINFISKRHALKEGNYGNFLRTFIREWFQKRDEHRMEAIFKETLDSGHEPTIVETLLNASNYLHDSFEGEAVLSIGKSKDFVKRGVSGIINVSPFTCMPGTIVSAILKRFREDHHNIPVLNMFFDGQEETNTRTRLEAYMYQVYQYHERKEDK
jgi:predicted CoA-substrate-specific enzyme activase